MTVDIMMRIEESRVCLLSPYCEMVVLGTDHGTTLQRGNSYKVICALKILGLIKHFDIQNELVTCSVFL